MKASTPPGMKWPSIIIPPLGVTRCRFVGTDGRSRSTEVIIEEIDLSFMYKGIKKWYIHNFLMRYLFRWLKPTADVGRKSIPVISIWHEMVKKKIQRTRSSVGRGNPAVSFSMNQPCTSKHLNLREYPLALAIFLSLHQIPSTGFPKSCF